MNINKIHLTFFLLFINYSYAMQNETAVKKKLDTICPVCNMPYLYSYELKRHLLTHNKEKTFKCYFENCKFSTNYEEHIQKHLILHLKKIKKQVKNKQNDEIENFLNLD